MSMNDHAPREPRRIIQPEEDFDFISKNHDGLQTFFLSERHLQWADSWEIPREKYTTLVNTVLTMDVEAIRTLRAENRSKEDVLEKDRETQMQILHTIDLFITGFHKLPKE